VVQRPIERVLTTDHGRRMGVQDARLRKPDWAKYIQEQKTTRITW